MRRISKFSKNALVDYTGIPLVNGQPVQLQYQLWAEICKDVKFRIRFLRHPLDSGSGPGSWAGAKPYDWYRILGQFETRNAYLLLVEGYSMCAVRRRFWGYWVRAHSELAVIRVAKDYSKSSWFVPYAYNWWWQRTHPMGSEMQQQKHIIRFQVDGVSDIEIEGEDSLTFRWMTRGLMRLRILPEPKLGFTWVNYNRLMVDTFQNLSRSKLRLRRAPEWRWPTSRTLWGIWRRFFEMTIKHAGISGGD